jgi:hypothetical protein
MLHQF